MAKNNQKTNEQNQWLGTVSNGETVSIFDSETFWRTSSFIILAVAAFLRFYSIALKPFHHDEGVNSFFLMNLVRSGVYKYDPTNYHGPTLYFFTQAFTYLFGLTDLALRGVTSFFGLLCVVGILSLRRYLGNIGALTAAMFIAVSPGMVYISRYFIHELLFVFFTFGVVLGVVKFIERERAGSLAIGTMAFLLLICLLPGTINFANSIGAGNLEIRNVALAGFFVIEAGIVFLLIRSLVNWNNGKPIYLLLASASLVLTYATKETAFISFGTMLIAFLCILIWQKIWQDKEKEWLEPVALDWKNFCGAFGETTSMILLIVLCIVVFLYVGALFFSSFFTYPEGIRAAFEAYFYWTKTGNQDHTHNGLLAYFKWLWKLEAPFLLLGALGALIAMWKAKHRFAMFAALWAWGILAAYTIIPYKTPWLCVNFILPLGLIAGYGINELAISRETWQRGAAAFLAALGLGWCVYQSVELNFYSYDDNDKPYIYAHTVRDSFNLIEEVKRIAEVSGKGKEASIIIASPDYWGLPWYLRDYPGAAFYGQITPSSSSEMIIGSTAQKDELEEEYGRYFKHKATYTLRPGVDLMLWVRNDLADK